MKIYIVTKSKFERENSEDMLGTMVRKSNIGAFQNYEDAKSFMQRKKNEKKLSKAKKLLWEKRYTLNNLYELVCEDCIIYYKIESISLQ